MRKERFFTIYCRKNLEIRLEQKNVKIKTRKEVKIMEEIKVVEMENEMGGILSGLGSCTLACAISAGTLTAEVLATMLVVTAPSPV